MIESWFLPFLGGGLLGILFFGGLWYTIIHGMRSPHPTAWFLISLVVRMALAWAGFVLLTAGRWDRLVACLVGFLLARVVALNWLPTAAWTVPRTIQEGTHASEPR